MDPRHDGRPKAIFFDAGNTLLRMNYAAIAGELARLGVAATADAVERAEWSARVRLDPELAAARGVSTERRATGDRYLRYLLHGLGVTDEAVVETVTAWHRSYNPPGRCWGARDCHLARDVLGAVRLILTGERA